LQKGVPALVLKGMNSEFADVLAIERKKNAHQEIRFLYLKNLPKNHTSFFS
jgi:hypothetical protein